MEYFVTGATGFIGTHLVGQLDDQGDDVIALTRSAENADHLPDSVEVVEGNITDKDSIREAMRGVDGVFHSAAWFYIGRGAEEEKKAEQINVEGTRNVLELMDELDIPKGVYTSSIAVYGDMGDQVVDETYKPEKPQSPVYYRTKWEAHYEVAKPMMEDGLPLIIVQPGGVYGPLDKESGSNRVFFTNWLEGDLPVLPRRLSVPFEYVGDTARHHILAMERGTPGEQYLIAPDESIPAHELFEMASNYVDKSPPRAVSPLWFAITGKLMGLLSYFTSPPEGFEKETLELLAGTEVHVNNSKAKRDLGIQHRSVMEGLAQYLEWEFEAGVGGEVDVSFDLPDDPTPTV